MSSKPMSSRGRRHPSSIEDRREHRRLQLLNAADRAVRRRGPLASMGDIAAEAGVAKPILYRHFEHKGGLYQALAERYVGELMAKLRVVLETPQDPRSLLAKTIDTYLAFVESEPEAYRFLRHRAVQQPEAFATVSDFTGEVARQVGVVLREGLTAAGLDTGGAETWAHGLVGMVGLAGDWWLETRTMTRAQVVDYVVTLVWGGFAGLAAEGARPRAV